MRQRPQVILLICILLFGSQSAFAEIYQCDGKWTNRPCDGAIERTLHEKSVIVDASEDSGEIPNTQKSKVVVEEPLAPRYALTRRLRKFSKEMSQKHNLSLTKEELIAFDEKCTKRETPLQQCQSEYDAYVQRLNSQVKKPESK